MDGFDGFLSCFVILSKPILMIFFIFFPLLKKKAGDFSPASSFMSEAPVVFFLQGPPFPAWVYYTTRGGRCKMGAVV